MNVKEALARFLNRPAEAQRPQAGTRFGISWPLLAALCLILVCAVGWAFFMGLMVGRGQNPQESIHAATGLMKPDEPAKAEPGPELSEPVLQAPAAAEAEPAPQAPVKPAPAKPARAAPAREAPKKNQTQVDQNQRFAWTFQGGAYRSQSDANAASAKLNKNGLKSTVRKSGKVWLIIISMQGTARDVQAMRQKVKALKLDSPMQLSKTPLEKRKRG